MDANIEFKEGSYTSNSIRYSDDEIGDILNQLSEIKSLLEEVSSEVTSIEEKEQQWEGESKEQSLELKNFMKRYNTDYSTSVDNLHSTISNLAQLLDSIPSAHPIKEIDNA